MDTQRFEQILASMASDEDAPEVARSDLSARWSPDAIFERLSSRVLNQDAAVRAVSERLAVTMTGLAVNPERPLGVFLFVGPPGVGKTGRLTDSRGKTVSFSSSIVVMTSNLGVREAERSAIGFASDPADRRIQSVDQAIRDQLAPEMISRLDDIVHFAHLDGDASSNIARHHLDRHLDDLRRRGWHLDIDDQVRELVLQSESAGRYGFRHLERNMERLLFTGLAGRQPGNYRCEVADGQLHWTFGN